MQVELAKRFPVTSPRSGKDDPSLGSRDGYFRILTATTVTSPRSYGSSTATRSRPKYGDDDWDSAGLIVDDYLFRTARTATSTSSSSTAARRRRQGHRGAEPLYASPVGTGTRSGSASDFSVENSVAIYRTSLTSPNSSGLVQGWDRAASRPAPCPPGLPIWTGDDVDATITIDEQGMLYVGVEYEKHNAQVAGGRADAQARSVETRRPDRVRAFDKKAGVGGIWGCPPSTRASSSSPPTPATS